MRIAILLFILIPFTLKAQKPFTRDYWLNEAATPIKVNAIAQDSIGYIWLGTDDGLICYNGSNFIKIADSIHAPVTALATANGSVWAGYSNGSIGIVTNQKVERIKISNGPSSPVNCLYISAFNTLIMSTEDGVFAAVNNIAVKIDEAKGLSDNFTYCLSIHNNHVVVGSDKGINDISLLNNKFAITEITSLQGLPDNIVRVIKSIPGTQLCWIGTQEGGITIYDRKAKKPWVSKQYPPWIWGQVNDILPVSAKRAWIATETGYLLDAKITDSATIDITPYSYPDKVFKKLLLDPAGNIWCGTNKGLTLMTGEYVLNIKMDTPYTLHNATAMVIENDTLFIALEHQLFCTIIKDPAGKLIPLYTAAAAITSLYIDKDKRLWIGTWGDGLYYRDKTAKGNVDIVHALFKECIINIAGTNENLWVSGLNGVEQLSYPDKAGITLVKHHDKKSGIGSDYVYQLYPDRKGNIWMATDGAGVCMYDGKTYHHWNSFSTSNSRVAYTITEDLSGDIWAGVLYKDLFHYHNNHWENLRRHETQYVDINISGISANATGQVISVAQRCIDEWYPKSRYFRHFNSALRIGIDSTSSVLNCMTRDKDGNVYLPYQHGILMFKNQNGVYDITPHVHITQVNLFLKAIGFDKHRFAYDENYLGFIFDGINFTNPERLNYRYKLEGYNNDWVTTRDGAVTYPKLPPGKYTFRVQTSLNTGYDHAEEDSYTFTITNPFWKTLWFYTLSVLICFGLIYAYIKIREKRLNKMMQLKQERMRFEYEHLKSQINPHFLFNSLNTLTSLIEENKENAIDYTVHLSDLYRYILAYPDKDLIVLSEECEILNNYIHIQKSRFGEALDVKMDIPDHVLHTKKIVPLALQMLVENAIKHNVVSASQPLVISITANDREIVVRNAIRPKISKEKKSGLGIINIVKRYKLLTDRQVIYGIFQNDYIVTLPLL